MMRKRCIFFLFGIISLGTCWFLVPSDYRNFIFFITQNKKVKQNFLEVEGFDISTNNSMIEIPFKNQYQIPISVKYEFDKINEHFAEIANYEISAKKQPELEIDIVCRIELLVDEKVCSELIVSSPLKVHLAWSLIPRDGKSNRILYLWLGKIEYPLKAYLSSDKKIRITIEKTDSKLQGCEGRFIFTPYYVQ